MTSNAAVTAKKNYAGAICGRMNLGLIYACEGYGHVKSETVSYVGGIAGGAGSAIRNCFVKATLSGENYLGGIIGQGEDGDEVEEAQTGSVLANNYAMVQLQTNGEHYGAISGDSLGSFQSNFFISQDLAGIDRVSYEGKAQPIRYRELQLVEGLPKNMTQFTLEFSLDGQIIQSHSFQYGASFPQEIYPQIPEKEGCYSQWDISDLSNLYFDTTVTAQYLPYTTSCASEQLRQNQRPVFYVEGSFRETDRLTAKRLPGIDAGSLPMSGQHGQAIGEKLAALVGIDLSQEAQLWQLSIPQGTGGPYTLRYLPEQADAAVYVKEAGQWRPARGTWNGSYLCLSVSDPQAQIAELPPSHLGWILLIPGLVLLLLLAAILWVIKYRQQKKRWLPFLPPKESPQENTPKNTWRSRLKKSLPVKKKAPGQSKETSPKAKKRRRILLLVLILLIPAAAAAGFGLYRRGAFDALPMLYLLNRQSQSEEVCMELQLQVQTGDQEIQTRAEIYRTIEEDRSITRIRQEDMNLYVSQSLLITENGNAYPISSLSPEDRAPIRDLLQLSREHKPAKAKDGDRIQYTLTLREEAAQAFLDTHLPEWIGERPAVQELSISLESQAGTLSRICLQASGTKDGAPLSAEAQLTSLEIPSPAPEIPAAVLEAAAHPEQAGTFDLTRDTLLLFSAWNRLTAGENLRVTADLSVDCGPISSRSSVDYARFCQGEDLVHLLRVGGRELYLSESGVFSGDGAREEEEAPLDMETLLDLAYELCLNGQLSSSRTEDSLVYTVTIDGETALALIQAIAPEAASIPVEPGESTLELGLEEGSITYLTFQIDATATVVTAQIPAEFRGTLEFQPPEAEAWEVPQAVWDAID